MKKIVFVPLRSADDMKKRVYPVDGNILIQYSEEVYYPINAVLAKTMKSDDEVKVVLMETRAGDMAGLKNAEFFKEELNEINSRINAKISYEIISVGFVTNKELMSEVYLKLIKSLDNEAEIYTDITFGPRALYLLVFSAMQFGEKFLDCFVGNVIYLKAEFEANKLVEGSQMVCDYTPLYLLNSFTNIIEAPSSGEAIRIVETLLKD